MLVAFHCNYNSVTYFIHWQFGKAIQSNIGNESQYRSFIGSYKKYRRSGRPELISNTDNSSKFVFGFILGGPCLF